MNGVNLSWDKIAMEEGHQRLQQARKASGFGSARSAATRFKWKISTYAAHENGQNRFDADAAAVYGKAYKVTRSWLLTGEGEGPELRDIESSLDREDGKSVEDGWIIEPDAKAGAGGGGLTPDAWVYNEGGESYRGEVIRDRWFLPETITSGVMRSAARHIRVFEVVGDSMEPRLFEGDRVFVDLRHKTPSPEGIFALWDGTSIVVKRLQMIRKSDPPQITVISVNEAYPPYAATMDEINIIGRYVGRFTIR